MRPTLFLVAISAPLAACGVCKPRHSSSAGAIGHTSSADAGQQTPTQTLGQPSVETSSVLSTQSFVASSEASAATPTLASSIATAAVSSSVPPVVSSAVSAVASSVVSSAAPAVVSSAASSVAASAASSAASSAVSSAASSAASGGSSGGFLFTGVSESGAEFGSSIPGTEGTDYTFPNTSAIDILIDAGMNAFRVPFLMERMIPTELTGTLDSDYFTGIQTVVTHITGKGAYAILDPHNYGRYYSNIITDVDGFGSFWTTLSTKFADNKLVIFDTNNEYHDMDNSLVAELNQAAITAIRGAGATSQYIFVEGNSYTGAWTWVSSGNGDSLKDLTDPEDKIIYEMHQYLDSDGSGTSETCVNSTIGENRLEAATAWLKENGKLGILGETAGANNDVCISAIKGELQYLQDNSDVWAGWLWWAAGPWWGDYMFSMEPTTGVAYESYLSIVQDFLA